MKIFYKENSKFLCPFIKFEDFLRSIIKNFEIPEDKLSDIREKRENRFFERRMRRAKHT